MPDMDGTVLPVLTILPGAAILAATLWRVSRGTKATQARDQEDSAGRHREITRRYREEQSRLGE